MNVFFVISGLGYGGAETQLLALAKQLCLRGHRVCIYLLTETIDRIDEARSAGIEVVQDAKQRKFDIGVMVRLRQAIKLRRPQVVHAFLFDANVYARLATFGLGVPVICSERSSDYGLSRGQALVHYPTRWLAAAVIANSHAGREHAIRLFGIHPSKAHVLWNGIDLEGISARLRRRSPQRAHPFLDDKTLRTAVLVGNISDSKDHLLALQVAEKLIDADARWRVLLVGAEVAMGKAYAERGAGNAAGYAEKVRIAHLASAHREKVVFLGRRSDAIEIIADADVLFSTSKREGFPNVVLEAMAIGIPVVSTDYSDIRRILPRPWQVVGSRKPAELSLAILKAFDERDDLTRAQSEWVRSYALIEQSADDLLGIYANYTSQGAEASREG